MSLHGSGQIYNYYDTCYGGSGLAATAAVVSAAGGAQEAQPLALPRKTTMSRAEREAHLAALRQGTATFGAGVHAGLEPAAVGGAVNDYSCGGQGAMALWLAKPEVVEALHVKAGTGGMKYGPRDKDDLRPLYKTLAQKYRLLIYSGDTDMCVPYVGTEEWTRELGFTQVEGWRPWLAGTNAAPNGTATAGYVTTYAAGDAGHNFTFLTVKGAGHMVPQFKPVASLTFLERFFNQQPF